jgi:hypothetical protein
MALTSLNIATEGLLDQGEKEALNFAAEGLLRIDDQQVVIIQEPVLPASYGAVTMVGKYKKPRRDDIHKDDDEVLEILIDAIISGLLR